jgi:hypothetical protein
MIRVSAEDAEKFYGVTDSSKTERYYLLDNGNIIDSCGNIRYIPSGYTCLIEISTVEDGAVREVVAYGSVSGTVLEAVKQDGKDYLIALCKKFKVRAGEICVSTVITKSLDYFDSDEAYAVWDGNKIEWRYDVV